MFLHLLCPYETNPVVRHNTIRPVSSSAFLLLFIVNYTFRNVFLPLYLPGLPLCFGSLYTEDVVIVLFIHKAFTSVPLHASWLVFLCTCLQSHFSKIALPHRLCSAVIHSAHLLGVLLLWILPHYSRNITKGALISTGLFSWCMFGMHTVMTGSFVLIHNM